MLCCGNVMNYFSSKCPVAKSSNHGKKLPLSLGPAENHGENHVEYQDILGRLRGCSQLMSRSKCSVYAASQCLPLQSCSMVAGIFQLFLLRGCWRQPVFHKFHLEWDHSCRDIYCYTSDGASRRLKILPHVSCSQPSLGVLVR